MTRNENVTAVQKGSSLGIDRRSSRLDDGTSVCRQEDDDGDDNAKPGFDARASARLARRRNVDYELTERRRRSVLRHNYNQTRLTETQAICNRHDDDIMMMMMMMLMMMMRQFNIRSNADESR